MSTEKTVRLDTIQKQSFYFSQKCISCENTRRLPEGMTYCNTPWMCDECKEAIAFLKDFMKSCDKATEMLKEMENLNENIHPL